MLGRTNHSRYTHTHTLFPSRWIVICSFFFISVDRNQTIQKIRTNCVENDIWLWKTSDRVQKHVHNSYISHVKSRSFNSSFVVFVTCRKTKREWGRQSYIDSAFVFGVKMINGLTFNIDDIYIRFLHRGKNFSRQSITTARMSFRLVISDLSFDLSAIFSRPQKVYVGGWVCVCASLEEVMLTPLETFPTLLNDRIKIKCKSITCRSANDWEKLDFSVIFVYA